MHSFLEVLRRTIYTSLENILNHNLLKWMGHVVRMNEDRLPNHLLYGGMIESQRSASGQMRRYKDIAKRTLKDCHMDPECLEHQASDRQQWRALTKTGQHYLTNIAQEGSISAGRGATERINQLNLTTRALSVARAADPASALSVT